MPRRRTLLILLAFIIAAILLVYGPGTVPTAVPQPNSPPEAAAGIGRQTRRAGADDPAARGTLADRSGYKRGLTEEGRLQIAGTVRGPEGELLSGIPVLLVPVPPNFEYQVPQALDLLSQDRGQELSPQLQGQLDRRLKLRTAADGSYRFELPAELPLGVVVAQRPGFAPDWGSLDRELLKWRRETGLDQAWPRQLRFDLQLQSEGRVSGRVLEKSSGEPATGAAVEIFEASTPRLLEADSTSVPSGQPLRTTLADRQGRYRFSGLAPGIYVLSAAPGRAAYAVGTAQSRRVRLEAGQYLSDLDFEIEAGGVVVVRVTDHSSQPISGATCAVTPTSERLAPGNKEAQALGVGRFGQDRTDAAGRCFLRGLWLDKSYRVLVFHQDLIGHEQREFTIDSEAGRTELEVKLWRRSRIAGWTVIRSGEPLGGVMVAIRSLHTSGQETVALSLQSEEDGTFSFQGLPPGEYRLEATSPGAVAVEISLGPGQIEDELELVVAEKWTSLSGRVEDDRGLPVSEAKVDIISTYGRGIGATLQTDSQGRFGAERLIGEFFEVKASHSEHESAALRRVSAGRSSLNLALNRLALVEGRLVDSQGSPVFKEDVPLFSVCAIDTPGRNPGISTREVGKSDDKGRFSFRLAPGKGYLLAKTSGYAAGSSEFDLKPGQSVRDMDIILPQQAQVKGRVVDSRGRPVQGAEVMAREVSASSSPGQIPVYGLPSGSGLATSDQRGRFLIDGLARKNCRVTARHPDWASSPMLVVDLSDARDPVEVGDLRLRAAGVIEGVLIAEGSPLANWPISLAAHDYHREPSATDANGRFRFEDVTPGIAILKAQNDSLCVERRLNLEEGGELNVRLELEPKTILLAHVSGLEAGQTYGIEAQRQRRQGDPQSGDFFFKSHHKAAADGTFQARLSLGVAGEYQFSIYRVDRQAASGIGQLLGPVVHRLRTTLGSGEQELVVTVASQ